MALRFVLAVGTALLVIGLGLAWLPLAFIGAGLACVLVALFYDVPESEQT